MASDDDFTFCQVGSPADQSCLEAQKAMPDISGVTLNDESVSDANCSQHNGILWKDKVPSNAISKKAATVGSLSFNVIDTSPREQSTELPKKSTPEDTDNSVSRPQQQKTARKPAPRAKVPFEKGYSQMDWLRLTQKHPDLAERVSLKSWPYASRIAPRPVKFLMGCGLKGQSNRRLITLNEVKQHQTGDAMWTVLKGRVYNIAPYMKFHPGGVDMLMKAVGKDCTSLFNKHHAWVNAEVLLEKCFVGTLDYVPVNANHL